MRKKTVNHLADTIFWYVLYFLPVIAYVLYLVACEPMSAVPVVNMGDFVAQIGLQFDSTNVIYSALVDLFGPGGILPLINSTAIFSVLTYYASVYIVHLAVDVLIFIPRLAHKWLDSFAKGVQND